MQERGLVFVLAVAVDFVGRDDHGGGYLVVGFKEEQAYALRGAAGGADLLGIYSDDLAKLADDYQFGILVYEQDRLCLANFGGRFQVIDALRTTRRQTVFVHIGTFPEAVLGDRKD